MTWARSCRCRPGAAQPGQTQSLHFYQATPKLQIVDMPGYGFAFADPEKQTAWLDTVCVCVLGRRAPPGPYA